MFAPVILRAASSNPARSLYSADDHDRSPFLILCGIISFYSGFVKRRSLFCHILRFLGRATCRQSRENGARKTKSGDILSAFCFVIDFHRNRIFGENMYQRHFTISTAISLRQGSEIPKSFLRYVHAALPIPCLLKTEEISPYQRSRRSSGTRSITPYSPQ